MNTCIITEGEMDVLALHEAGIPKVYQFLTVLH